MIMNFNFKGPIRWLSSKAGLKNKNIPQMHSGKTGIKNRAEEAKQDQYHGTC